MLQSVQRLIVFNDIIIDVGCFMTKGSLNQSPDGITVEVIPSIFYALRFGKTCVTILFKRVLLEGSFEPSFLPSGIVVETMPLFFYALLSGGFSAGKSVEYPGTFRRTGKAYSRYAVPLCFEQ